MYAAYDDVSNSQLKYDGDRLYTVQPTLFKLSCM